MKTYLEQYYDLIKSGGVVVGYWVRKEVENLIEDMNNPAYIYDTTEAHKRIKFMQTLCLQSKQPYYMKPLVLAPWQLAYWESLYSFKMADTGLRRFTESLLVVARKNGKSTMFAADGNFDLFCGEGGADICCASNDDRQAKLIWREISGMRTRLDPKKSITSCNLTEIRNDLKNITVFRLSSKTQNKDGFNISKTYLDESHDIDEENKQSEVAEACWRGMSSKDEPLFMNCTTQGFNRDCYLDGQIETAQGVINGEIDDIHLHAFLYMQDSEAEIWQDPATWEKSNPSIRYGVKKTAKLVRDIEKAKRDKGTRIHLLCKDFNIPQNTAQAWLAQEEFDYPQEVKTLEDFRGCYCLAAVDLAETTDLTNAKLLFMREGDNTKYVFSHYWIPEIKLKNADDKNAGAQYKEWAKQGYLTICEGADNDLTLVADWLAGLKKEYGIKIVKCGYDVKFSKEFINRMEAYGIETELIQQSKTVLSSPMKWVEADLKAKIINYGLNPVDKWCLSNAAIEMDNIGRQMCVKIKGQHSKRIDGAVTLIILYATLQRFKTDFQRYIK